MPGRRIQKLIQIGVYPNSQAEADLQGVLRMYPLVARAAIMRRALEIGLSRLLHGQEDLTADPGAEVAQ